MAPASSSAAPAGAPSILPPGPFVMEITPSSWKGQDDPQFLDLASGSGCVIFVLDCSGVPRENGDLEKAKQATLKVLASLPHGVDVGVVFTHHTFQAWPPDNAPAPLSDDTLESARVFIDGAPAGGGSCDEAALLHAIAMARASASRRRDIIYVSDGRGTCAFPNGEVDEERLLEQTVENVTRANRGSCRLHAVWIRGNYIGELAGDYMKSLAERNGGTFLNRAR